MGFLNFFRNNQIDYNKVDNEGLQAISLRFRGSKEDTVFVTTSRICPTCSVYNRRIYSLFGRYKDFPILPEFLHQKVCPTCKNHIGFSHYFPGMNGKLKSDILFSNKPFIDNRTSEEKQLWNEHIKEQEFNEKTLSDYNWICKNLPDLCPKSLGGYKRMVKSNSSNYQKLVSAAKEHGYTI